MLNVLKADIYRIVKDKMFIILLIIGAAISVVLPVAPAGIYMGVAGGYNRAAVDSLYIVDVVASPSSAFGLVLGIFILIFLGKDATTLRHKVIGGISRKDIYFSNLLLCIILYVGLMLAHSLLTFVVTEIFFDIKAADFLNVFLGFLFKVFGYFVIAAILSFFGKAFRTIALGIVLFVILAEVTVGFGSIVQALVPTMMGQPGYEHLEPLFKGLTIVSYALFQDSIGLPLQVEHNLMFCLTYFTSLELSGMAFIGFGYLIMQKKDLK
jgi:hypothetical protein